MAFGIPTDSSTFLNGMKDWKHVHQRLEEHEKSIMESDCAEAYFLWAAKADIQNLLRNNQMSATREQIHMRCKLLERVIDIVKVIGKRGLSYRGTHSEAAYTLDDFSIDHGNFLEMVILLSKYDVRFKEHMTE